jgi:glycosyltransferase involved in cell wall biosynthesis
MLVVDGNDVAGDQWRLLGHESPSVHPAIQNLLDGLAERQDLECRVLYGALNAVQPSFRSQGSVLYEAVPYRRLPLPGGGYLGRTWSLLKRLRQLKPDLVHAQGTERESALAAVLSGFPNLLTLHGNFREISRVLSKGLDYYRVNAWLETRILRRTGGIVCISNYVRDITREFGKPQRVIPNAVGDRFLNQTRPPAPPVPRLCFMGTFDRRKRPDFVLRACIPLWKAGLRFTLHLLGKPGYGEDYQAALQTLAEPWKKQGLLVEEGFLPDPAPFLAGCHLMLSASKEESFGMNVAEALAVGTPVIAPRVGGIQDILEEGEQGFLVDPEDPAAMTEKIRLLLEQKDLWEALSGSGRKRMHARFSPAAVAGQTLDFYRDLLASTPHGE